MDNNEDKKTSKKIGSSIAILGLGLFIGGGITFGVVTLNHLNDAKTPNTVVATNPSIDTTSSTYGEPTDLPPYNPQNDANAQTSQTYVTTQTQNINTQTSNASIPATPQNNSFISLEDAKQIALNNSGGGTILHYEQDLYDDDDLPTYKFKIKSNNIIYKIEINANTGDVIDFDTDD